MNTYLLLRKGESHPVYCEDFAMMHETPETLVFAVLDGCSSGTESHFASALIGKLLRKNAGLKDLKSIMQQTFIDLQEANKLLNLNDTELLATVLLGVYDKQTKYCEIIAVGDGFVLINDKLHEIDQQNMPDYWAYHLRGDFEHWWKKQTLYKVQNPQKIAISTDGLDTFKTNKMDLPADFDYVRFLLFDAQWANLPTMLARKFAVLHTQYGYKPFDDVGLILINL